MRFEQADLLRLAYPDERFDVVVAANVIHLLEDPCAALRELERVCRPDGRLILPTYMNRTDRGTTNRVSGAIGRAGADFKREFTPDIYKQFFAAAGYPEAAYLLCEGRIPCAVAVLRKSEKTGAERGTPHVRMPETIYHGGTKNEVHRNAHGNVDAVCRLVS